MNKIRKGDQVVVLSGKDKGRQGTVLDSMARRSPSRTSTRRRSTRSRTRSATCPAESSSKPMPLHISKIAIWNVGAKKADRVGIKQLKDGKRVRFFKSNGEVIDA